MPLQTLTELLVACTHEEVLAAALRPAISALNAVAGTVLLLDAQTQHLSVAASQGHDPQTVWQAGLLAPETPVGDVLSTGQPLYFEHAGALRATYPHLEVQTGGVAPVATAVLPLLLDGQSLGVLVLDFHEPHTFTPDERRFLTVLASQTSIALNRAQRNAETDQLRRIIEVSPIGMAVGSLDVRLTLVNDAYLDLFGYTRQEYEQGEFDWQALTLPEYRDADTQAFETAFSGVPITYEKEMLTRAGERLPMELTLIRYDARQVVGYFKDLRSQRAQVQALRTEGERLTRQVALSSAALTAEQKAAQAFVTFTEAAGQLESIDELGRLALDTLQAVIPGSSGVFYDRTASHWQPRVWSGDLRAELIAVLQQGVPLTTPVFAELLHSRAPVFVDGWTEATQGVAHTGQFQTVAVYPVSQQGQVRAALSVALQSQPHWTETQQAIIRSVGRSFSLLYDRISIAGQLELQRTEAQQRAQVLEAFLMLTRDQVDEADTLTLIRRAQELVLSLLPPGLAAYYKEEDGCWRLRVQTGEAGNTALQETMEAGFPVGQTPSFDLVAQTHEPSFVDVYAGDTDVDVEVAGHIAAHASLPLMAHGQMRGIFNVPLFETRQWSAADRALLNTAVRSLGIVIERAERSAQLEHSNEELLASNTELEAFTYSASHDLRTPVRHVMGFAELAEKAIEKGQYDKAGRSLEVVKQGALRMTDLIDGMLVLSRSGRQELHLQPVDLNVLVSQARRDVAAEFGAHPVRWQSAHLPTVSGDPQLLQQVMTNLLSNAVKYSAKREVSEVRVWAGQEGAEWRVSVQDNGIGFAPDYAHKLFGIFQRLHTEREFKGTGVGLATVKRIVQKHGGRVFAESDGEHGATFGFILPK